MIDFQFSFCLNWPVLPPGMIQQPVEKKPMLRTPPERRTLLIDPDFNGAFQAGPTDFALLRAGKDDAKKLKRLMQENLRESGLLPTTTVKASGDLPTA